jgi:hypothetical protein
MKCIDASTSKGQRLFRDADEWIAHEDKRWVFSFDNVCDMLDINPEYMRMGLRKWKEKRLDAIARRRTQLIEEAERAALEAASQPETPMIPVVVEAPAAAIATQTKIAPTKPAHMKRRQERVQIKRGGQKLRKVRA